MQKPPRGTPGNDRGLDPRRRILCEAAARPSSLLSGVGSTAAEDGELVVHIPSTVGVHVVSQLTRLSNKRSQGLYNGLSEGPSAVQRRAGAWKGTEEEELKRLVGSNTGSKGVISWVKVMEAWVSQKLPPRTKASLSSRWYEIRSRTTLLGSTGDGSVASGTVLSGVTHVGVQSQQDADTARNVNKREKGANPGPAHQDSVPVEKKSLEPGNMDNSSSVEIAKIFRKNYRKAQKMGFQILRKAPKRVSGKHIQPIISRVDDLMREISDRKMKGNPSWNQLSVLVYAGALTVDEVGNLQSEVKKEKSRLWFRSTLEEVSQLRKIIGKATAELNRRKAEVAPTDQQLRNIRLLERKYKCKLFVEIASLVERLKCRLYLLLSRIELRKADEQRTLVRNRPAKALFRDKESGDVTNTTDVHLIRRYWKSIVGVKKDFDQSSPLLIAWKQALPSYSKVDDLSESLNMSLWQRVVSKLKPWKATGPDGLQGFWWKKFTTANTALYKLVHHHLTSGASLPRGWITDGRIVLLHKSGSRSDPANFRPIACLNTCYKLLTGFVTAYLERYVTERKIIASEQRALQKGVWGCTHALLLDQTLIADACNQKQRPISVGWIDYAKAFDSVPHTYIQWLFRAMQVPNPLRIFLEGLMNSWRVKYEVKGPRGKIERSSYLRIRSGVLQGDSFSPLLFCLAMVPISHALNNTSVKYTTASGKPTKTQLSLSHQFYMDDLKMYANSEEGLTELLRILKEISTAINMKLNPKKCALAHFIPRRLRKETDCESDPSKEDEEIPLLAGGSQYKYLGIDQEFGIKEEVSWDRVASKCIGKFRQLWTSDLTFRQKVGVHNSAIIPALTYVSSNIINGGGTYVAQLSKGEALDKLFRKIMVEEKSRYKASAKSRLYLTSDKGGYGLTSVKDAMEESTIYTWAYLSTREDLKTSYTLFEQMANRGKRSVLSDANHVLRTYSIEVLIDKTSSTVSVEEVKYNEATLLARRVVGLMRDVNNNKRYEEWRELTLSGRVLRSVQAIDLDTSFEWLRKGLLSSVGVRNVLAAQEGCLLTRSHPACRNNTEGSDCRMCKGSTETVEHVISCCSKWLSTLYIDRHDSVARNIYYILCRKYDLQPPHYTQRVESVQENDSAKLYWNQPVQTRAIVRHNKPDLIAFDKVRKTALIIEVAVSWFTGIEKQIEIKRNRYCVNGNYTEELQLPYPRG